MRLCRVTLWQFKFGVQTDNDEYTNAGDHAACGLCARQQLSKFAYGPQMTLFQLCLW